MSKVYLSYNNIVSTLGFDSQTVVNNVANEISGLQRIHDTNILPNPFYSSVIDDNILNTEFNNLSEETDFTRLEKMMILSLNRLVQYYRQTLEPFRLYKLNRHLGCKLRNEISFWQQANRQKWYL